MSSTNPPALSLSSLPTEIHLEIHSYLTWSDKINLSKVSNYWQAFDKKFNKLRKRYSSFSSKLTYFDKTSEKFPVHIHKFLTELDHSSESYNGGIHSYRPKTEEDELKFYIRKKITNTENPDIHKQYHLIPEVILNDFLFLSEIHTSRGITSRVRISNAKGIFIGMLTFQIFQDWTTIRGFLDTIRDSSLLHFDKKGEYSKEKSILILVRFRFVDERVEVDAVLANGEELESVS